MLDRRYWPEIAARAKHESLREIAAAYGVSHETIHAIVQRARHPERPLVAAVD